jgi:hypothetical protein
MLNLCTVALVLLLDVSGSVSDREFQLQQRGIAESFRNTGLYSVIEHQAGGIAVMAIEWGTYPKVLVPWQRIQNREESFIFADRMENSVREMTGATSLALALEAGINAFNDVPCEPEQRVIDISGDGSDNVGDDPIIQRDRAISEAIIINAMPILNETEPDLEEYFRDNVITTDGFLIIANGYSDFARAIRRKLILEIAQNNR